MNKLEFFFWIFLTVIVCNGCMNQQSNNNHKPCAEVVNMEMTGFINNSICFDEVDKYKDTNQKLILSVSNTALAGKLIFEIQLNNYSEPETYQFDGQINTCELIVQGAADEFYKCTSGIITITQQNKKQLEADFEIDFVGFYNKKTLKAKGTISLGTSKVKNASNTVNPK